MATRCAIGVEVDEGIRAIYCHWDGYISHVGNILHNHYDLTKTLELIGLGDLSSIAPEIGVKNPKRNAMGVNDTKYCVFYGRDRDETGTEYRLYKDADDLFKNFNAGEEFYYVLARDGHWYVRQEHTSWLRLSEAIAQVNGEDE